MATRSRSSPATSPASSASRSRATRRTCISTRSCPEPRPGRYASPVSRRRFSYPISLAVVVAALIALTGGWIAWWNYRSGVANVRILAASVFEQIAREAAGETEAFLMRAPPAAASLANLAHGDAAPPTQLELAHRVEAVLRANPSFTWVSYAASDGSFTGAY